MNNIFEKTGASQLSTRKFNIIATLNIVYGFLLISGITWLFQKYDVQIGIVHFLFGGIVIPIVGVYFAMKSSYWTISLIAYHCIVLSLGTTWSLVVEHYYPTQCVQHMFIFAAVFAFLSGTITTIFPLNIKHGRGHALGGFICTALSFTFLWMTGWKMDTIPDMVSLFLGIGIGAISSENINRAYDIPKNLDNAVDIAVEFYRDPFESAIYFFKNMHKKRSRYR